MKQCSNDSMCAGVKDSACNGKNFVLCGEKAYNTTEKSCIYEKQRNYHFRLLSK